MKLNKPFVREIPLELIHETGNVRKEYNGIEELAASIRDCGLLQPITVKVTETDENGNENFEIICGHRRFHSICYLQSQGEPYNTIKAIVVTGDKAKLQLVENVQRENLSPIELEQGLKALIENGMQPKEIAEYLSKSLSWVCDSLAGGKVREQATMQGIDTNGISTKAMSQLRTVPAEQLPEILTEVKANGGTVKAATKAKKQIEKPSVEIKEIKEETPPENNLLDFATDFKRWTGILLTPQETEKVMQGFLNHKDEIKAWLDTQETL